MINFDKIKKCEKCGYFDAESVQESSINSFIDILACTDIDIYYNVIRCKHLKICRKYEKIMEDKDDTIEELRNKLTDRTEEIKQLNELICPRDKNQQQN